MAMRVADIDRDGRLDLITADYNGGTISLLRNLELPTDVAVMSATRTRLESCFPNPARRSLDIRFVLSERRDVSLCVYDVAGRVVRRLVDGRLPTGQHTLTWNRIGSTGRRVAAGVYFCELRAGAVRQTRRIVLLN